jgi:6-phosphogluconolactonase
MPCVRCVVDTQAELVTTASKWLEQAIDRCVRVAGSCSIALSGGNTPRPVYARLALSPRIAWERLHVYFADERCVSPDDPASNYRMIHESLLARTRIPAPQIHRIFGERSDIDRAAEEYAALLPERLDVIVLGIGADGHTASLFPGAEALTERSRRAVHTRSPVHPFDRISVTPPVITNAGAILVLASGGDKAAAVSRALAAECDPTDIPARLASDGTWIVDRLAAGAV